MNAWVAEDASKLDQDLGACQDNDFTGNQFKQQLASGSEGLLMGTDKDINVGKNSHRAGW